MGDDNDFTFCQVGSPIDQEHLKLHNALPDIGRVTIQDNQVESSSQKEKPLDNAKLKNQRTVGSLSFTVVDMSSPKNLTELPKQSALPHSKDSVNSSEEKKISTKKPIVPTKVPFEKGYSQMDWLKLTRTHPDLAGLKGESCKRLISMDEVKKHRTEGSIWTVLKGRVYNISPYMNFHPGGVDMLMKAAGKDCTSLFNNAEAWESIAAYVTNHDMSQSWHGFGRVMDKYHAWVNAEVLLEKCLVGTLNESR